MVSVDNLIMQNGDISKDGGGESGEPLAKKIKTEDVPLIPLEQLADLATG